jgi:uncharacterized membrane protein
MNQKGLNHLFKFLGILLILLSFTIFAHSIEYRFDCSSEFNCEVKSYCQSVSGAVEGLLVSNGRAYSYIGDSTQSEPTTYYFEAVPGTNICSATIQVTAMHNQSQSNETTTLYINGTEFGTTRDNYCNGSEGTDCTFCGIDQQYLGQKTLTLQENNSITLEGHDSHAVVAVILDCVPQYNPNDCYYNSPPQIEEIPNREMHYNEDELRIDLWDYIEDYDDRLTDLNITIDVDTGIDCELKDNRYIECETDGLGEFDIRVDVNDDCDSAEDSFIIQVVNNPPIISVPDQEKSCVYDFNKFIDLRNYSIDEEKDLLDFNLLSQSNTSLIDCNIEDDYYLTCYVNNCAEDESELEIEVEDIFGETDTTTFKIILRDGEPRKIKPLPDKCFNEDTYEFLDLRDYFEDTEGSLEFELEQSNSRVADCFIDDEYYLSCRDISNLDKVNTLTIYAIDSKDQNVEGEMEIRTNCFGNYNFSAEQSFFCLEECVSHAQEIKITNKSEERECFDFDLDYRGSLNASLSNNSFCLNEDETTYLILNVNTCTADHDFYDIEVYDWKQDISMHFEYSIGNCNNFEIKMSEYDGKVCQGETRTFSVEIENNTNSNEVIELLAENQLLLPYFSKKEIYLEAHEKRKVDLIVNAKHADIGKYVLLLGAESDNYHVEKRVVLEVKDCSNLEERNFIIEAPSICYDVSKGEIFEGSFNVRRVSNGCDSCSFATKGIDLKLFGMQNELSQKTLYMEAGDKEKVYFTIKVPNNAKAGANFLTITGEELEDMPFDDVVGSVQDEIICLNVEGTSSSEIEVESKAKDILWCESEIFEMKITNNGDFDESFNLRILRKPRGVSVSFSEDEVLVKKGETESVYVSISSSPNSEIKNNQYVELMLDGNISLKTKIYFNIKEKASFDDLEILSYTKNIEMLGNDEDTYLIQIRNNSEKAFEDVNLIFENLPKDINIEEKTIPIIYPGEIKVLEGKIISGNTSSEQEVYFVFKDKQGAKTVVLNKKAFNLKVEANEASLSALFGLNTGLFSGISGQVSASLALSAFLIVLLLIIIVGVSFVQGTSEDWVEMRE